MASGGTKELSLLIRALNAQKAAADIAKVNSAVGSLGKNAGSSGSLFGSAMSKIEAGAGKVKGALSHAVGAIGGLVTGPLGFLGITAGLFTVGGAFGTGLKKAQDWGLQIEKLQGITRDSAEELSGLLAVTEKFGLSNERLSMIAGFTEKSLGNLQKGVTDTGLAIAGTSKKVSGAQKFLSDYGFSILDSKGKVKDFSSTLLTFSDYWNGNTAQGLKAAAAAKLFGRGYADLVPILNLGSKGIKAAEEEAAKLGLVLTQDNVVALAKAREATRQWGDALGGLQLQLGLALLPQLTKLATWATSFVAGNRDKIVKFFSDVATFAGKAAGILGDFAGKAASWWNKVPPEFRSLLVKGIIADRTLKFLFGVDPIKASAGGIGDVFAGALKGIGSGVASSLVSSLKPIPVFVVNKGFGLPGLGGAAEGAGAAGAAEVAAGAAGASGLAILSGFLAAGAVVTVIGMAAARIAHSLAPDLFVDPQAQSKGALGGAGSGGLRPFDRYGNPTGQFALPKTPFSSPADIGRNPDKAGPDFTDDTRESRAIASYNRIVIPADAPVVAGLSRIALAIRSFGYSPAQWASIYARAMAAGGRSQINTLAHERNKLDAIALADSETSKFLTGQAGPFFRDGKNQTRLLASLSAAQKYFNAHGDTATAAKLGADIALLKNAMKPPTVNVDVVMNSYVTVAAIAQKTHNWNRYGRNVVG